MMDINNDFEYDSADFLRFVKEIIQMPYLNRLKQFLLQLLRNNLLLGKRIEKLETLRKANATYAKSTKNQEFYSFWGAKKY